jgi:hypothetical protein
MREGFCKTVTAMVIGAASALGVGIPLAALILFLMALARGEPLRQALLSAYFALMWGFYLTWPSSIVLGAVGGVLALKLAQRLQGGKFLVWVALCGAALGALNVVWLTFPSVGYYRTFILVGAIAGLGVGLIAGPIIRWVCVRNASLHLTKGGGSL